MYERAVVKDMNEQTAKVNQAKDLGEMGGPTYPDPTAFLFNKYLIDSKAGPEVYFKGDEEEKMSPRRRFFLFNKQQPQFAL
jgi:hypothetical protein